MSEMLEDPMTIPYTHMIHVWYIYLHECLIFMVNYWVNIHPRPMDHMGYADLIDPNWTRDMLRLVASCGCNIFGFDLRSEKVILKACATKSEGSSFVQVTSFGPISVTFFGAENVSSIWGINFGHFEKNWLLVPRKLKYPKESAFGSQERFFFRILP